MFSIKTVTNMFPFLSSIADKCGGRQGSVARSGG